MGQNNYFPKQNVDKKIEMSLKEFKSLDTFINSSFDCSNFEKLNVENKIKQSTLSITFGTSEANFISIDRENISPYSNTISEKEFFKIVGYSNYKLSKRSGKYQAFLLERYLEARKENDFGYIKDILLKAIEFQNNLNYVKTISKNKKFLKEWKENINEISPLNEIKETGSTKKIDIIRNRI